MSWATVQESKEVGHVRSVLSDRVTVIRAARPSSSPLIRNDCEEVLREERDLRTPTPTDTGEPHEQDDRITATLDVVVDLNAVHGGGRHSNPDPFRPDGQTMPRS